MIKKLRFLLMKLGINYWIDTVSGLEDHNHYIFTSLNFKTLKSKKNIDYNLNDLKKGISIEKSIKKNKEKKNKIKENKIFYFNIYFIFFFNFL